MSEVLVITPDLTPDQLTARLSAYTVSTALTSGVAATVASESVDVYGTITWRLQLTRTDGTRAVRVITARHNGTTGADATTATWSSQGEGDLTGWTIACDLNGAGTAQLLRLRVTAPAANWTASVTRAYHKAI